MTNSNPVGRPAAPTGVLSADLLRHKVDPHTLRFNTTAELRPESGLIGQDRALQAIRFGASIDEPDFNLFVLGPPEAGKRTAVKKYLEDKARGEPTPCDWVYVNNFTDPNKPIAITLPRGRAQEFRDTMVSVIDDLQSAIPSTFEGDDYQGRRRAIHEEARSEHEDAFEGLEEKARSQDIALLKTPMGFALAPVQDGQVIEPKEFSEKPEDVRKAIEEKIAALQTELADILRKVPKREKERQKAVRDLNEEFAELVIREALSDVRNAFSDVADVVAYTDAAGNDLVRNVGVFLKDGTDDEQLVHDVVDSARDPRFRRYMVNVFVSGSADTASGETGAPIIDELNPTYSNLIGRTENISHMGTLVTDFLLLRPGALHRANGGYLILDARKVLMSPFTWEALKRALKSQHVKIEQPTEMAPLLSTQSLEPDPVPLNVKVVLFGDRELYYLLSLHDPEFARFFKVAADFDDNLKRTDENTTAYASLIASIAETHETLPLDASGVAAIIEHGSRLAGDNEKLSIEVGRIADIVREANFRAKELNQDVITDGDVKHTIAQQIHRADRLRERSEETMIRNTILVDTDGEVAGQINGLSVLSLGQFAFGRPSRITASVRVGAGRVTDIEREVQLGGPLHSKGVMILWGYLASRYAQNVPLSLAASLVFEQSYGGVDGDSASSAELYALLSALSEVPIKQSYAVTGSVNQLGEIQAIGGVNEKIEGFFDLCKAKGLTGRQGVLIPSANVKHLMLREDVVEAVREEKFAVHSVESIDQGIEILTGQPAGTPDADGQFPPRTINHWVEQKLYRFAEARRAFGAIGSEDRLLS
ncbi:MAG: Lon protease family protein [Hyphomicrobiaceae bacterium]